MNTLNEEPSDDIVIIEALRQCAITTKEIGKQTQDQALFLQGYTTKRFANALDQLRQLATRPDFEITISLTCLKDDEGNPFTDYTVDVMDKKTRGHALYSDRVVGQIIVALAEIGEWAQQ